jgi:hypothetical protein
MTSTQTHARWCDSLHPDQKKWQFACNCSDPNAAAEFQRLVAAMRTAATAGRK